MKLRSIMYALAYGKSRKSLVRSGGARRVKQAEKLADLRKIKRNLTFCERYVSVTPITRNSALGSSQKWLHSIKESFVCDKLLNTDQHETH